MKSILTLRKELMKLDMVEEFELINIESWLISNPKKAAKELFLYRRKEKRDALKQNTNQNCK
jgi:hypothetical protein